MGTIPPGILKHDHAFGTCSQSASVKGIRGHATWLPAGIMQARVA